MRSHPSFYSRINSLLKSRLSKKKEISHAAFYHRYLPAQTRSFDFFRQDERGRAKRLEKVHGGYGVWRAGYREPHPDALKENIRKKNTVEQPARKLTEDMPPQIKDNYLSLQPVSLYSHIHSAREKNYTSVNDINFQALE